jgi:PAS domain-containing protein
MRDEHRPKHELIHEIAGLRKQIVDLKEAMIARRRVEDALRAAESVLRTLADGAPVGLCLFRPDGTPLRANTPFAHLLGYDSPAELQRIGSVLGVFASPDEGSRVLSSRKNGHADPCALFRAKDGEQRRLRVMAASCPEGDLLTVAVFDPTQPFPPPAA